MTLAELMESPIGTTDIYVFQSQYDRADGSGLKTSVAVHRRVMPGRTIESTTFYGENREAVREQAYAYDNKIKEGRRNADAAIKQRY